MISKLGITALLLSTYRRWLLLPSHTSHPPSTAWEPGGSTSDPFPLEASGLQAVIPPLPDLTTASLLSRSFSCFCRFPMVHSHRAHQAFLGRKREKREGSTAFPGHPHGTHSPPWCVCVCVCGGPSRTAYRVLTPRGDERDISGHVCAHHGFHVLNLAEQVGHCHRIEVGVPDSQGGLERAQEEMSVTCPGPPRLAGTQPRK